MEHNDKVKNGETPVSEIQEATDISHYGILGMKWGIRKQPDGGVARTGSPQDDSSGYEPKNPGIGEGGEPAKIGSGSRSQQRKEAKSLSTKELGDRIKRLEMEKKYVELTSTTSTAEKGRQEVNKVLSNAARNIATQQVTSQGNKAVDRLLKSATKKKK